MEHRLDAYLNRQDAEHDAYVAAKAGNAWTVNGGIGILSDGAVRLASPAEVRGITRYWIEIGARRQPQLQGDFS